MVCSFVISFSIKGSFDFIWYVHNICLEQPSEKHQLNTAGQIDQTQFDDDKFFWLNF